MSSQRVSELKRRMNELVGRADLGDLQGPEARAVAVTALRLFEMAGAELLDQAAPFLWAYYRRVASEFDAAERASYGIPELSASADIWDQVEFRHPPSVGLGGNRLEPGRSYLSFEGEVSWEPEHGLQLVFEEGLRVCKVGPYDGHLTNAHAYNDVSLLGVVFR